MSLVALAVRIAAIKMLRGATLAGETVIDSPVDPVDQMTSVSTPIIHVYTEEEALRTDKARDLLQGERTLSLTFQIFIPVAESIAVGGKTIKQATRRGGGQLVLDLIYRQIEAALATGQGVWPDLFRGFVDGYQTVKARPFIIKTEEGLRLVAREIELICEVQSSPAFGPMTDLWAGFVAALVAEPNLAALAPLVSGAITGAGALDPTAVEIALLGLSNTEAAAIGLLPDGDDVADDPGSATTIDTVSTDPAAPAPDGYTVAAS